MLHISSITICQEYSNQNIDELQKEVSRIENEIKIKMDSLNSIKNKIQHLQNQEYLSKFKINDDNLTMSASLIMDGKLRKSNSPYSEIISIINKNDTVILTDFQNDYWIVNKGYFFGYLSELYINETKEVKVFKQELERKNEKYRIKKEKEQENLRMLEEKQKLNQYRQKILKQFGNVTGQKLLDGYYWIGMTDKMATISLGEPRNINRTVGSWGVHEQWVYYSIYLYFENGILKSYQNSR